MTSHSKVKYTFAEQAKLASVLIVFCVTLIFTNWLWVWNQNVYDMQIRSLSKPAPEDIVIVAIDETSLNDFGRWPWPRSLHASLIEILNKMGAKTIVLDIVISDEDKNNKDADQALANAIHKANNVVLPILAEQTRLGSQLKETLPLPLLIEAGAALGHVHIELDGDGIARSTFLYEGLGSPRWPHISLTALQLNSTQKFILPPASHQKNSPFSWHRAHQYLIPFLGPPGHFSRISYTDVINGLINKENISGKIVFVGVTATGLGDALPTPLSGLAHPMPGVEINANIFSSLRENSHIQVLNKFWLTVISIIIIMLPVIFFPRISPRMALILTISLMIFSGFLSLFLFHFWHIWFAPLAAILSLSLSYPLWSWRRLEFTTKYLDQQIQLLSNESGLIPKQTTDKQLSKVRFLTDILACKSWVLYDRAGHIILGKTTTLAPIKTKSIQPNKWTIKDNNYWLTWTETDKTFLLGLKTSEDACFTKPQLNLLDDFRNQILLDKATPIKNTIEIIEQQISQVTRATDRLRAMRQFISASLDQMADAVVISSSLGDIVLYNQQAEKLLGKNNLDQYSFLEILEKCHLVENTHWKNEIFDVISAGKVMHCQGTHSSNKDLLIQIAPLITPDKQLNGLIANFSDITHIKNTERKRNEYINFVSHDLRSPLNSALALIELSLQGGNNAIIINAERLKQYTERALALTENFVQIARADNIDKINFIDVDLLSILYNAADQLWELANEKNIVIDIYTDLTSAECMGDASLIERALVNLIDNAIKYSPDNSKITASIEKNLTQYHCAISDQGYGIPKKDIPDLFTRFHRSTLGKQHNIPGIGLGLSFVKIVADAHNGSLNVVSEDDKGSTFTLSLPICP